MKLYTVLLCMAIDASVGDYNHAMNCAIGLSLAEWLYFSVVRLQAQIKVKLNVQWGITFTSDTKSAFNS